MADVKIKKTKEGYVVWRTENIRKGKHTRVKGSEQLVPVLADLTSEHPAIVKNKRRVPG